MEAGLGTRKRPVAEAPAGFTQATQLFGRLQELWDDWLSKYEPEFIATGVLARERAELRDLVTKVCD